jgi:hypothetical protein
MTKVGHSLASELPSYSESHTVMGRDRDRLIFNEV